MDYKNKVDLIRERYTKEQENNNLELFDSKVMQVMDKLGTFRYSKGNIAQLNNELLYLFSILSSTKNRETFINTVYKVVTFSAEFLKTNYYSGEGYGYIWEDLLLTYKAKNRDYNNSAEKSLEIHGVKAFEIRLQDKISRVNSFTLNHELQVEDEKIVDTIKDMIGYCIIFLIWDDKQKGEI